MEAGKGSDKVPGRDVPALFSYPLSAVQGSGVSLTPGASTANLPVRGALVLENDRLTLRLLKTGEGSLPGTVPVLKAVRDEATGLDRITVPAVGGLPPRTVLINPVPVPVAPADTGNRSPVPVTPWHTGTAAKPVETLVTTVTPEAEVNGLQDFIYWRPDAVGTGVQPMYVMFSDPLDSGRFTRKQLDKKYLKHASDFGIKDTKKNRETLTKFRDAIEAHLADKETIKKGTYPRKEDSDVFFNPNTNNVIVIDSKGKFVTGWKLKPGEPQFQNFIDKGILQ
ncbi:S-type pyocin domain-containing protein [Rahnella victoriana]|uniref:S-type pyocin domain-containing protein n=1 Tax=Rahnella victoriana TaxID=1510570 RepID=A0ABS0DVE5_9GAMM|nr:S-type pyocin domain-containing protein [Rahnella victoriana]MBF7957857.1 S-type pyocin domain-containing protein [Rahnella victoriana]